MYSQEFLDLLNYLLEGEFPILVTHYRNALNPQDRDCSFQGIHEVYGDIIEAKVEYNNDCGCHPVMCSDVVSIPLKWLNDTELAYKEIAEFVRLQKIEEEEKIRRATEKVAQQKAESDLKLLAKLKEQYE